MTLILAIKILTFVILCFLVGLGVGVIGAMIYDWWTGK